MRFLVGALLLAGCALWMQQNNLVPGQATTGQTAEKLKEKDIQGALGVLSDWFTNYPGQTWIDQIFFYEMIDFPQNNFNDTAD